MPENNIKWHIGHELDIWSYSAGKTLKYRLNVLSSEADNVEAVLRTFGNKYQKDIDKLDAFRMILRSSYFFALDKNIYIPHLVSNYEQALDEFHKVIMTIINRENMTSSSIMQNAMISFEDRRKQMRRTGGEAQE